MCQGWACKLSCKQAKPMGMRGEGRSSGAHKTFCNFLCCTKSRADTKRRVHSLHRYHRLHIPCCEGVFVNRVK